ncbi:MAG: ATP-dependent DNA helicase, partial [Chromatiales bacterium]
MGTEFTELLGATGPLAKLLPGFAPRVEQQRMAEATAAAIAGREKLIVEAGTGTRHLQDQLYGKDLPVIREALKAPLHMALLKGRTNYLCLHRLETAAQDGRQFVGRHLHDLEEVRAWAGRTRHGDIAELGLLTEDSPVWPRVTSTTENCLGQECEYFQDCFVTRARRNALEADVVVINHHLLFADMVLREEGFGELLPGADAFIIDEAHQLPEVASVFFGTTLSSHQLRDLARDVRVEQLREAADVQELPEAAERLAGMVHRLRLALGQQDRRAAWSEVNTNKELQSILEELAESLHSLHEWLQAIAARGKGLESCCQRAALLKDRLAQLMEQESGEYIHWFETFHTAFRLNLTPLNVAPVFRSRIDTLSSAWVFTSATLAVGDSFTHFAAQLGLEDAQTLQLDSPFDYRNNALLYLPGNMPEPNEQHYTAAVVEV